MLPLILYLCIDHFLKGDYGITMRVAFTVEGSVEDCVRKVVALSPTYKDDASSPILWRLDINIVIRSL